MLRDILSNRLFMGALAFFVLIVVGGTLYLKHVERETVEELARTNQRIKTLTEKQPPTPEAPVGDTLHGGHFHEDGTWHAEPHETPVRPAAEVSLPQTQTATRQPLVIVQGNPITDPIAEAQLSDAEKQHTLYQQRVKQHLKDHAQWMENFSKAHTERMQAGQELLQLFSDTLEKRERINRFGDAEFSDAERQEIAAKVEKLKENIDAAVKKLDAVMKEEPVSLTSTQTN